MTPGESCRLVRQIVDIEEQHCHEKSRAPNLILAEAVGVDQIKVIEIQDRIARLRLNLGHFFSGGLSIHM
jgi:hypothetical protein